MSRLFSCTCGLSMLAIVALLAQNRPDLSGRWIPVEAIGASQALLISQDATALVAESTDGAVTERLRFNFTGPTQQDVRHANVDVTSTASWKGVTLSVTSTFTTKPDGIVLSVREEEWSLDADSRLVIAVTTRRSGGQSSSRRTVYRRQP